MTRDDRSTEHLPSDPLQQKIAELTRHQTELKRVNQSLVGERQALKRKLTDCSRFLQASTTGLISLDKSGLIDGVSPRAVDMLGADQAYLLKKPISLFIAPEDQAVFFINRSRIFAGAQKEPFELKLKTKNGAVWSARVNAQPVETPNQYLPGMLLAVEDITPFRQALENLQLKEYFVNLLFSIIDDLSISSPADIDEMIVYALEKVGLVSGADRVYVCLFHDRKTRLSITHEWLSDGIGTPAPSLQNASLDAFSRVLSQVKKSSTVTVADMDTLTASGCTPTMKGSIPRESNHFCSPPCFTAATCWGSSAVMQSNNRWPGPAKHKTWSNASGSTIVNALIRRQCPEGAGQDSRDDPSIRHTRGSGGRRRPHRLRRPHRDNR